MGRTPSSAIASNRSWVWVAHRFEGGVGKMGGADGEDRSFDGLGGPAGERTAADRP
jgi:hypothetical protein